MTVPPSAQTHQVERAQLAAATALAVRAVWQGVDPEHLQESWLARAALAAELIGNGQLAAVASAEPWLISELGQGEGVLQPEACAAATGDLAPALLSPLLVALNRIRRGFSVGLSILSGAALLEMVTRTLIADAGRIADMAGMIARPRVVSYVRVVEAPACARCIVLAGREYTFSEGFLRHPRCDCTMAAKRPGDGWVPDLPKDLAAQMTAEQLAKAFGKDAAAAIADGADVMQLVNARRGMSSGTYYGRRVQTTSEGTTRRGLYGRQRAKYAKAAGVRFGEATTGRDRAVSPRLMPEEIYRLADGDRQHAIRLLKKNGYIV